jgi:Domain of unknown function (DUF5615)
MRFLADENVPSNAVAELKAVGYDVVWVRTVAPGSKDEDNIGVGRARRKNHTYFR